MVGRRALIIAMCLVFTACSSSSPTVQSTPTVTPSATPSAQPTPSPTGPLVVRSLTAPPPPESGLPSLSARKIATGNYPAGLAVAPDGRIFYTELYGGNIRVIDARGHSSVWYDVNTHLHISWRQFFHGGLTAITIDPDFASNHYVFAVTQVPSKKTGFAEKSLVLRFTEKNGQGTAPKVLLTTAAAKFDNLYSLVFASDGTIFLPSGHDTKKGVPDVPGDLVGEIVHITRDGDPAPGNPFGARAPKTWAYGIRNSFDVAVEPTTGYLIGGENSTVGHDEIDLIAPGQFYGWSKYEGIVPKAPGMTQPLLDFGVGSHWAPVGMIRYDGARYPKLRGMFLVCMNHKPGVYAMRIDTTPPARLVSFTKIGPQCSIDIAASAQGRIYVNDASAIYELS